MAASFVMLTFWHSLLSAFNISLAETSEVSVSAIVLGVLWASAGKHKINNANNRSLILFSLPLNPAENYCTVCTNDPVLLKKLALLGVYVAVIVSWPTGSEGVVMLPRLSESCTVPNVVDPEVKVTEPSTSGRYGAFTATVNVTA